MRTTLSMDDGVFEEVKAYAKNRDVSLCKAISELVRQGLHTSLRTRIVNGFHVVDLPLGSPALRPEDIKRLEQESIDHLGRELALQRGADTKFTGRKRRPLSR